MQRDQTVAAVANLTGMGKGGPFHRGVVGADRFQNAQTVLIDVNPGAGRAQAIGSLVYAHAPAPLRQRARRRETGKSGADDLCKPLGHCIVMPKSQSSDHCPSGKRRWLFQVVCV